MKVAIVGGGPSGLYLAILLRRWDVTDQITVFEQNPKDATYGFGVALAEGALNQFAAADPASHDDLVKALYPANTQDIENPQGEVRLTFPGEMGTITRLTLLQVLQRHCDDLGVDVRYGERVENISQFDDFDLVVGADGANSRIRTLMADDFGYSSQPLSNHFAWYGFTKALPTALRFRRRGEDLFIAHYYPYTAERSTFLVEVDGPTWRGGFGALSDDERRAISEEVFADILAGGDIIENKSNWTNFQTVECTRWATDRVVLVGDAQYRGHFSIGSGTRLAMEDTIALAKALKERESDIPTALAGYEAVRRPKKAILCGAAENSYNWYERVREIVDLPIEAFAYNFLTRTGRMPDERLRGYLPDFMARYDAFRAAS